MRFARTSRCCAFCARSGGHPERSRGTWVCGGTPIVPPARAGPSTTLGMTRENRAMSDEPYFTVLAHDKFRRANLTPAAEQEFFASGDVRVGGDSRERTGAAPSARAREVIPSVVEGPGCVAARRSCHPPAQV